MSSTWMGIRLPYCCRASSRTPGRKTLKPNETGAPGDAHEPTGRSSAIRTRHTADVLLGQGQLHGFDLHVPPPSVLLLGRGAAVHQLIWERRNQMRLQEPFYPLLLAVPTLPPPSAVAPVTLGAHPLGPLAPALPVLGEPRARPAAAGPQALPAPEPPQSPVPAEVGPEQVARRRLGGGGGGGGGVLHGDLADLGRLLLRAVVVGVRVRELRGLGGKVWGLPLQHRLVSCNPALLIILLLFLFFLVLIIALVVIPTLAFELYLVPQIVVFFFFFFFFSTHFHDPPHPILVLLLFVVLLHIFAGPHLLLLPQPEVHGAGYTVARHGHDEVVSRNPT
ncbi:hypothetical protein EYF80_035636 [Liparis tanakae]|uniref:Uncharacterized protein n=1 Tax=Liparis tanakae TaxID=230148 RepID=A0A4Z2GKL5_9TELE|nr:hypothetical protein EYF80_035636 [Liparis tanakae]